jgi:hypothetical protein
MFDIYVFNKLENNTYLNKVRSFFPDILDTSICENLTKFYHPRFLEIDISQPLAMKIFSALKEIGLRGRVVKSAYRNPLMTIDEALVIADKECQKIIAERNQTKTPVKFNPTQFTREDAMWWTFAAVSEELVEQGFAPGAVQVSLDKLDGHIWSADETESWLLEQDKELSKFQKAV